MKQSSKVALGGVIGALSLMFMILTIIPVATYALPAIAGAILIPIVIELGAKWGAMVYGVVAVLSIFVAADKEAAILFITFFGYYPVLKAVLERAKQRFTEWLLKFIVFNVTMVASYMIMIFILKLPMNFELFGINLPLVFLILGNGVFWLYDVALSNVITLYIHKLHKVVSRIFRF